MKSYLTITLGCKVNQCESAAVGHSVEARGYGRSDGGDSPDVVIINTCTVTGRAAMQSRQTIRQTARKYPGARIVVTGCYAQTAPEEVRTIAGVDLVVGHDDKLRIAQWLDNGGGLAPSLPTIQPPGRREACGFSAMPSVAFEDRTRAFLKIQDGCNTRCTYCIVPYARGRSRSMPETDVIEHVRRLADRGIREVVLTGIHLGVYGADLTPGSALASIIEKIMTITAIERIRLSSIEPMEIDDRIIASTVRWPGRVCRHFHIPLQSGDNGILKRMGRPYTREIFSDIVGRIHAGVPDAAIGVDVMAGFPGESEIAFDNTYHLLETLPVTYLHVFPYSPRKGTPAAGYRDQVPQRIAKERCRRLRELGERKRAHFQGSLVGRHLAVLTETATDPITGRASGLSDNYLPVAIIGSGIEENQMVRCCITAIGPDGKVIGRPIHGQRSAPAVPDR